MRKWRSRVQGRWATANFLESLVNAAAGDQDRGATGLERGGITTRWAAFPQGMRPRVAQLDRRRARECPKRRLCLQMADALRVPGSEGVNPRLSTSARARWALRWHELRRVVSTGPDAPARPWWSRGVLALGTTQDRQRSEEQTQALKRGTANDDRHGADGRDGGASEDEADDRRALAALALACGDASARSHVDVPEAEI